MRSTETTKTNRAYSEIRRGIIVGDLEPGMTLDENMLAAKYNEGRTPVREALKRLTGERLVVWPARRSPHVRIISAVDLRALYEARLVIEPALGRIVAQRHLDDELDILVSLCDEMEDSAASGDAYRSAEADIQLHSRIASISGNTFLQDAIERILLPALPVWYSADRQIGMETTPEAHRALVRSLRSGDAALAGKTFLDHIMRSYDRQLVLMQQRLDIGSISASNDIPKLRPAREKRARE